MKSEIRIAIEGLVRALFRPFGWVIEQTLGRFFVWYVFKLCWHWD